MRLTRTRCNAPTASSRRKTIGPRSPQQPALRSVNTVSGVGIRRSTSTKRRRRLRPPSRATRRLEPAGQVVGRWAGWVRPSRVCPWILCLARVDSGSLLRLSDGPCGPTPRRSSPLARPDRSTRPAAPLPAGPCRSSRRDSGCTLRRLSSHRARAWPVADCQTLCLHDCPALPQPTPPPRLLCRHPPRRGAAA